MSHAHAIRSKKIGRGEGVYGSPEVFPIISAHSIPLALHHRPSTLVYKVFGRYGDTTEWSEGGTERGGGMNMLTRARWALQNIWDYRYMIWGTKAKGKMPQDVLRAWYKVKKKSERGEGVYG